MIKVYFFEAREISNFYDKTIIDGEWKSLLRGIW